MTAIFTLPRAHPVVADTVLSNGKIVPRTLPGAKLHFYLADTVTPVDTFTSSDRLTKHTWPVVADATGKFPAIYLAAGIIMDAVLKSSDDSLIDTYEDIPGDTVNSGDSILSAGRGLGVGSIIFYSLPDEPAGWKRIKKDPQALPKASYPELNAKYAAQGYPYGSASTTFNIPGGAGLFPRIWDPSSSWDPDAAARLAHADHVSAAGNVVGSFQPHENKSHTHNILDPGHAHDAGVRSNAAYAIGSAGGPVVSAAATQVRTSTNTTGITASSAGGTESRPDNIAFPFLILVDPGSAAVASAAVGMAYRWSVDVSEGAPAAGFAKGNAADIGSITVLRLAKADLHGADLSAVWGAINDIPGTRKATLHIRNAGALANGITAVVSGTVVINADHVEVPVTALGSSGTLIDGIALSVQLAIGALPGDTGPTGPNSGLDYRWDTGTADADPGGGNLSVNNATLASATFLYISKTGRNAEALGTLIGQWGASTNPANKGYVRVLAVASRAKFIEAAVTGAAVDGTTYWKIPITVLASGSAFAANDLLCVVHTRSGDVGTLSPTVQVITASGTWTRPSGCRRIHYRGCAGGGSGGGASGVASQVGAASGGAAGGEFEGWLDVTAVATIAVTIGAGGTAPTAGANNGNAGGNTQFAAYATANGGAGGTAQAAGTALGVTAPVAGGTTTGGDARRDGGPSEGGIRLSGTVGMSGSGASGTFGSGGRGLTAAGAGVAGSGYGSGGGGALSTAAVNQTGGAGAPGVVIVEEFY